MHPPKRRDGPRNGQPEQEHFRERHARLVQEESLAGALIEKDKQSILLRFEEIEKNINKICNHVEKV